MTVIPARKAHSGPGTAPHPAAAGLSSAEARRRLKEFGPNELAVTHEPAWKAVLPLIADPLVLILIIASIVAAAVGEITDAVIINAMVITSVVLNFTQTYRSQRAAHRLREQVAATALVLRDGAWGIVLRRELVPGDIIRLAAGDLVPADATLLTARDLHVHEAALTGESLPVEKEADSPAPQNSVYLGTSIVSGTADALVVRTGLTTEFGDIAARLSESRPETEFERGTRRFGAFILRTILVLVVFVILAGVVVRRDPLQSVLFALALAVGLAPEFLPMIRTVTLARAAVRMSRNSVIVKHLSAIQNFGSIDILCSDKTGTLTTGAMSLERSVDVSGATSDLPLQLALINSRLQTGIRSPLDDAIIRAAGLPAVLPEKIDEIPFDFERRMVSVVVSDGPRHRLITKGAPESVLARSAVEASKVLASLSATGARVLAVARRSVGAKERYGREDERDLEVVGFLTFADPPIVNAREVLAALREDGVQVKILTGDSEVVARHVCSDVGIDMQRVVLGSEIERMSEAAVAAVAEQANVFARLSPAQKTRIVGALKGRGHVVGFLGDGINDAPSLRAADVGISVANATGVAKEAAEIILSQPGLDVLHRGILEGRRAFGNVMKYVLMETSSNFGNMFSMAAASLFLPFLPMLPTQILLNNLMYDVSQLTIPTDRVDATFMRKPQRWDISMIRRFMLSIGPVSSLFDFATFGILLYFFRAPAALFQTGWFVESLTTQTLVLFVIRTAGNPFRSRPSTALLLTGTATVAAGFILPFTSIAQGIGLIPLPPAYFAFLVALTVTYLLLVEIVKRRVMRRQEAAS